MREIKFRVWEKYSDGNEMHYVDLYWFEEHMMRRWPNNGPWTGNYELMQYTGLTDRSGKEIYEGDIVATGIGPKYVKSIVRIGKAETYIDYPEHSICIPYYGVYLEGSELEGFLFKDEMYILGNIYETPGLLKDPQK